MYEVAKLQQYNVDETGTTLVIHIPGKNLQEPILRRHLRQSHADLHHWDAIGIGRDRSHIDDSALRKIALCRVHHTEAHTIGCEEFTKKYLVYGIQYVD